MSCSGVRPRIARSTSRSRAPGTSSGLVLGLVPGLVPGLVSDTPASLGQPGRPRPGGQTGWRAAHRIRGMDQLTPAATARVPEKPTVDGLEARWTQVWEEQGTYRFDRSKTR